MKHNSLVIFFLTLCLTLFILSETLEAVAPQTIGFKIGYNRNQLRGKEDGSDFQVIKLATNGLTMGLVGNIKILNWLYFQPEFLYQEKGGKYEVQVPLPVAIPGIQVNVVDTRHLEYLEIPLLLKVVLPLKWPVKPTLLTGLSAGFKLRGNLENNVNLEILGQHLPYYKNEEISDQLNDIELSYVLGGGLDFALGRSKLAEDQRFYCGLKANKFTTTIPASYFNNTGIPVPSDIIYALEAYNYVFSVSVSYLF